jgi:hypothetical protein
MPFKDLKIQPEVSYTNWDAIHRGTWSGIMRFERVY